jgi:hypothetical protein
MGKAVFYRNMYSIYTSSLLTSRAETGGRGGGGSGIPPKPACGRRGMQRGVRVSQALKRLLREFLAQGYALFQRNSNNLVYICGGSMETTPPFRNLV